MKKLLLFIPVLLSGILLYAQQPADGTRVIVRFKPGVTAEKPWETDSVLAVLFESHPPDRVEVCGSKKSDAHRYHVLAWKDRYYVDEIVYEMEKSPVVAYAEADGQGAASGVQQVAPNDQYYFRQWGLKNDGSFSLSTAVAGADIDMENGWDIEQGSSSVVLGVIDSGTKLDHPEFSGRLWTNSGEVAGNSIDDDNNGFVDDINGWDFANGDNDPTDDQGHGTNVAGIACASGNNSIGYAGVDWNCRLMTMKGLNASNNGFYSWWADAIYYAVDNGAHVLNMSMGGSGSSITLQNAVNYALSNNVTIVVSMMNFNNNTAYIPASYTGVIAVGSTDPDDTRTAPFFWSNTSGSCYGNHISVVAPGNYMYGLSNTSNTDYSSYWGGTSQATPLVSGLATLLLAQTPGLIPSQIKSVIEATAEDQVGDPGEDVAGWDQYHGYGRINANYALSVMTGMASIADKNAVAVFPNPSNGAFTVSFPEHTNQLLVYDAAGKLLQTHTAAGLRAMQLQTGAPGVYVIRVETTHGWITKKIVVTR